MKKLLYALLFFIALPVYGAISNGKDMQWEIRSTATNRDNGGGFLAGATGTDYSQQDSTHSYHEDLVIDAVTNTNITSASHPFDAADVGNIINISTAPGQAGWTYARYEIKSVADAVATLDRACGTVGSIGGVGLIGGALPAPIKSVIETDAGRGNIYWVKSGTYTTTALDSLSLKDYAYSYSNTGGIYGYSQTRGDNPRGELRPCIKITVYTQFLYLTSINHAANLRIYDISGNASGSGLVVVNEGSSISNCEVIRFGANGGVGYINRGGLAYDCTFTRAADTVNTVMSSQMFGLIKNCHINGSLTGSTYSGYGFNYGGAQIIDCLITGCKVGIKLASSSNYIISGNTIYGYGINTSTGIDINSAGAAIIHNNNIVNQAVGITDTSTGIYRRVTNCDYNNYWLCKSTYGVAGFQGAHDVLLDPQFVDAANGNFAIGTNLANKGNPITLSNTTTYPDIGFAQRQEPEAGTGTGGGTVIRPNLYIKFE